MLDRGTVIKCTWKSNMNEEDAWSQKYCTISEMVPRSLWDRSTFIKGSFHMTIIWSISIYQSKAPTNMVSDLITQHLLLFSPYNKKCQISSDHSSAFVILKPGNFINFNKNTLSESLLFALADSLFLLKWGKRNKISDS